MAKKEKSIMRQETVSRFVLPDGAEFRGIDVKDGIFSVLYVEKKVYVMDLCDFYRDILIKEYGNSLACELETGLNAKKMVTLRANRLKSSVREIEVILDNEKILYDKVDWYEDAFILKDCKEDAIYNLEIYKEGEIYLQSLSSMIPPVVLEPKEGDNILDMAAAPGGKTTQIASITGNKAFITACERNKIRGEKLKFNLEKQGAKSTNVMLEDARNLSDYFSFDKILLDAPCSGSGTDNVFKKNFTLELIEKSSKTQITLLKKALKILKPGGVMVYSTCSILRKENEDILRKVLKEENASIVPIKLSKTIPTLPVTLDGTICVKPNNLYEGFYVAKIIKNK